MPRISWSAAIVLTSSVYMYVLVKVTSFLGRIKYEFNYPLNIVFCCRQTFRMPLIGPGSRQPYVQWTVLLCIHGLCVPCPQLTVTARSNAQCSKSQLSTSSSTFTFGASIMCGFILLLFRVCILSIIMPISFDHATCLERVLQNHWTINQGHAEFPSNAIQKLMSKKEKHISCFCW